MVAQAMVNFFAQLANNTQWTHAEPVSAHRSIRVRSCLTNVEQHRRGALLIQKVVIQQEHADHSCFIYDKRDDDVRNTIPVTHLPILESRCFGHVATVRSDGLLSVNPVAVMWDGNSIWFSTLSNRGKVRNLKQDDRISVSITHPDDPTFYLELRGRGIIEPDPDRSAVNAMAKKFMGVDEYPYDAPDDQRVVVRLQIQEVSAPRIPRAEDES